MLALKSYVRHFFLTRRKAEMSSTGQNVLISFRVTLLTFMTFLSFCSPTWWMLSCQDQTPPLPSLIHHLILLLKVKDIWQWLPRLCVSLTCSLEWQFTAVLNILAETPGWHVFLLFAVRLKGPSPHFLMLKWKVWVEPWVRLRSETHRCTTHCEWEK